MPMDESHERAMQAIQVPALSATVAPGQTTAMWRPPSSTMHKGRVAGQRYWHFLNALWAFYFLVVFSVGRYPELTQRITWGGAVVVGVLTAFAFLQHRYPLPREAWLLWAFTAWCLSGLPSVVYWPAFQRGFQLVIELAVVVSLLGIIIRYTGSVKWFYLAFIGSVFFNVLIGLRTVSWRGVAAGSDIAMERDAGLTGNPNALGFYCFIGILSVMALFGETKSKWVRVGSLFCTLPAIYGLVSSASRGAFSVLMVSLILWPLMCLRGRIRDWLGLAAAVTLIEALGFLFGQFVMKETYLGHRFESAWQMEDSSSESRLELFVAALKVFAANPIKGVGLGQFRFLNGLDLNSHDEWGGLLSGTGAVGFLLFMSVYLSTWLRLTKVLKRASDKLLRYRVNFARMVVLLLTLAGAVFRTNFSCIDSFFLIAIAVGTAEWAEREVRQTHARARNLRFPRLRLTSSSG